MICQNTNCVLFETYMKKKLDKRMYTFLWSLFSLSALQLRSRFNWSLFSALKDSLWTKRCGGFKWKWFDLEQRFGKNNVSWVQYRTAPDSISYTKSLPLSTNQNIQILKVKIFCFNRFTYKPFSYMRYRTYGNKNKEKRRIKQWSWL